MYKKLSINNETIWYDPVLLVEDPADVFEHNFWKVNNNIIGKAQGRGTTWFIQTRSVQAALRHYRRGGLVGKLIEDSYWFSGWEKTRSYQEYVLLTSLNKAGVHVPKPLAARAIRKGLIYKADLLTEKIPNAQDLVSILTEGSLATSMYHKIGREIGKMHHAQVNHTDLNIHNILIDDNDKVWLIDFDKCFQQTGDSWKQGNLDRLKRSFEKEVARHQIHWHDAELKVLLEGYQSVT
ncbi:3-deoxy-D-manno-octulosonic acid kinase [Vibrio sp. OCN044]|uniref:3-deoxy-D-manno-octulosonic acid kinase n=1 Tax=Vibrio tetraodonis subsp. pristinus TaxID=2695891 RepID=A0A6L8LXG3_9VIBR|nr:3-deoxy-D-manno-octulosonic acid kinase [Vibrio tetraodonis]MYM60781.1 3-deoxy-D-manno-octulosonic acid kinase [Vibrio tetraodonis subsp. pristinus]